MTDPKFATTGNDSRFYRWPKQETPVNLKSVTTATKKGVPNPVLSEWMGSMSVELIVNNVDVLVEFKQAEEDKDGVKC